MRIQIIWNHFTHLFNVQSSKCYHQKIRIEIIQILVIKQLIIHQFPIIHPSIKQHFQKSFIFPTISKSIAPQFPIMVRLR